MFRNNQRRFEQLLTSVAANRTNPLYARYVTLDQYIMFDLIAKDVGLYNGSGTLRLYDVRFQGQYNAIISLHKLITDGPTVFANSTFDNVNMDGFQINDNLVFENSAVTNSGLMNLNMLDAPPWSNLIFSNSKAEQTQISDGGYGLPLQIMNSSFKGVQLFGANITNPLNGIDFSGAYIKGVYTTGTMTGCDFSHAVMDTVDLSGGLVDSSLYGALLKQVKLGTVKNCVLDWADITAVTAGSQNIIDGGSLMTTSLTFTQVNSPYMPSIVLANLDAGNSLIVSDYVDAPYPQINWVNCSVAGIELTRLDVNTKLFGTDMRESVLSHVRFIAPIDHSEFIGSSFDNVEFAYEAPLTNTSFRKTIIKFSSINTAVVDCDFSGANLNHVNIPNAGFSNIIKFDSSGNSFVGARISNSSLCRPTYDSARCEIKSYDFTDAVLDTVDIGAGDGTEPVIPAIIDAETKLQRAQFSRMNVSNVGLFRVVNGENRSYSDCTLRQGLTDAGVTLNETVTTNEGIATCNPGLLAAAIAGPIGAAICLMFVLLYYLKRRKDHSRYRALGDDNQRDYGTIVPRRANP